jgi:hypothetical protein
MATTNHYFIIDGEESLDILSYALATALSELGIKAGLTINVKDVTIERNPHGNGLWNYTLKVSTKDQVNNHE